MTPALFKQLAKELSVLSARDGIVSTSLPTSYQSDSTGRAIKKEWDKKETSVKQHPRQARKKESSLEKEQYNNKKLPASNFPSVVHSFFSHSMNRNWSDSPSSEFAIWGNFWLKGFFSDRSCLRSHTLAGLTAFKAVSQHSSHLKESWHFTFTMYTLDSSSQADVHKTQQSFPPRKKTTSRLRSLLWALEALEWLHPLYKTKGRKGDV